MSYVYEEMIELVNKSQVLCMKWRCELAHGIFLRFSGSTAQVRVRMRRRVCWDGWELFSSSATFGAATIDCAWQSASRHGVKKAPKNRERCENVGKWEPGICRNPKRHRATPETTSGQPSNRGAGRSMGRWRERKSCGSPGSRRGHGVQMSGWLARTLPPLLLLVKLVTTNSSG